MSRSEIQLTIELTVLGSGTSVPTPGRRPPAFLLQVRDGAAPVSNVLVDCGAGATSTLADLGVGIEDLDAVLLTHHHPDHTADLVPLLFALRNPLGPPRTLALPIIGPPRTEAHLEALRGVYGDWIMPRRCAVEVHEVALEAQGVPVPLPRAEVPLRLRAFAVAHGPRALAYRAELTCHGRTSSLCLSGDCAPCPGIEAACAGVDLFVCECGASETEAARVDDRGRRVVEHLAASDVGALAARGHVGELVLTHLYEHVLAETPLKAVARTYAGPARLGEDGLVLHLPR